jgi:hypothetical protein
MGKKSRIEREEKRDSFATQRTKEKRKHTLIAIAVISGIVAIIGISVYNFANLSESAPGAPPGAGKLGDEHEHASILVRIFGDKFDFSLPAYQVKSSWIHFEAQDGNTIHRHSSGVTLGYLFQTIKIGLDDKCFIFPNEKEFCTNEDYSLKFYINHNPVPSITDLIIHNDDRILISYGNENQTQIDTQLAELDTQPILS